MNIQSIDFQPLFTWINKQLNSNVEFSINLEGKRPTLICPNLIQKAGIFKAVVKEATVDFFNYDYDETTGNLWATVYIHYESWGGGSNSMQIGTCWFSPETGWTFKSVQQ